MMFALILDSGVLVHHSPTRNAALRLLSEYRIRRDAMKSDIVRLRPVVALVRVKSKHAVIIGSAGGRARTASLSPKRRSEIARNAAKARWSQ